MHKREKIFADLLDSQNRKWIYPTKRFKIGRKKYYKPDFYLPEEDLYIEVVGSRQAYHINKDKISKFKKLYPKIKFQVLNCEGNNYPRERKWRKKNILN